MFNNRDDAQQYNGGVPVFNSGGISVDGQGGIWVAAAGIAGPGQDSYPNQVFYASPGGSFNSVGVMFTNPQITTTAGGEAYVASTGPAPGPFTDIYKLRPDGSEDPVTSPSGGLYNSSVSDIAVDRCYAACSVAPPSNPGGVVPTKTIGPLTVSTAPVKLGSSGLPIKLTCSTACSVVITGSLSVGGKASAASGNTLKKVKVKLKAGKTKTVKIKLSKAQKKKVKAALKKKRAVTAKLKFAVTPKKGKKAKGKVSIRVK